LWICRLFNELIVGLLITDVLLDRSDRVRQREREIRTTNQLVIC